MVGTEEQVIMDAIDVSWLGKYSVRRMGIFEGMLVKHMKSPVSPYEGPEVLGKLLLLVGSRAFVIRSIGSVQIMKRTGDRVNRSVQGRHSKGSIPILSGQKQEGSCCPG